MSGEFLGGANVEVEEESLISEYYAQAVEEIEEEYKNKTAFEKQVMFGLVINDRLKKQMEDKDYWKHRAFGPTKKGVKNVLEYDFDFGMNCGGFALEVFACIFPGSKNIEDAVANITRQFPFVRTLEEEGLRDDEYYVFYRCNDHGGHHFVKFDEGKILEKNECGPVQEFNEWPDSLKDAPEVTLAVKRGHEIEPRDENGDRIYSFWV